MRKDTFLLKLYVSAQHDTELIEKYKEAIWKHNQKNEINSYPDAGFDLFIPQDFLLGTTRNVEKVNLQVKCAMFRNWKWDCDGDSVPVSYYTYPRSSIHKTPLRLANSVGIIDSGYRGNLIAVFDNIADVNTPEENKHIQRFQRLVQVCSSTLAPICVQLVDKLEDLGITERGEGGFGSTGK